MSDDQEAREYCTANLVDWLRAKWKRHGELEDKYAADALESYAIKLDACRKDLRDIYELTDNTENWDRDSILAEINTIALGGIQK